MSPIDAHFHYTSENNRLKTAWFAEADVKPEFFDQVDMKTIIMKTLKEQGPKNQSQLMRVVSEQMKNTSRRQVLKQLEVMEQNEMIAKRPDSATNAINYDLKDSHWGNDPNLLPDE
jgi:hypothetical protein